MALVLLTSGPDFAALTDRWRIPRAEVRGLREAGELLRLASARADAIAARTAEAEAQARRHGFDQGLEEGRAAGAAEATRAVAALAAETRQAQAELRAKLGALSLEVVRRIATSLGPQAVIEALVERAAREVL